MKILITYFSATDTTKNIALKLSNILDANLFEIEPKEKYTDEDLDYYNKESRTTIEMQNKDYMPAIIDTKLDLSNYDKILIGFPIWWYTYPTIINTFLTKYDLSNKKIYVFATSGGTSIYNPFNHLKENYPSLNFISGKLLNRIDEDEIRDWIK